MSFKINLLFSHSNYYSTQSKVSKKIKLQLFGKVGGLLCRSEDFKKKLNKGDRLGQKINVTRNSIKTKISVNESHLEDAKNADSDAQPNQAQDNECQTAVRQTDNVAYKTPLTARKTKSWSPQMTHQLLNVRCSEGTLL